MIGVCFGRPGREFWRRLSGLKGLLLLVSAAVCVPMAWSRDVRAEEPRRAVLHYQVDTGIDGCFETPELEDAVAARLGYVPFGDAAALDISAHVRRVGKTLSAELKVRDEQGTRSRQLGSATRDCGELSRAMALAISVAIDPMSLVRAPAAAPVAPPAPAPAEAQAPPPDEPKPAAPPAAAPVRPPEPQRGADLDSNFRVRWLATGHLAMLALPGLSGGASLGLGLRRRALWTDAELRYDFPAAKAADAGGRIEARFLGGTLAICHGNRNFGLCPLGLVGRLAGHGYDVQPAKKASSLLAGVGARVSAELPLFAAVFARIHLDALYLLTPTELQLRGYAVWRASPVSLVPGVGLGGQL